MMNLLMTKILMMKIRVYSLSVFFPLFLCSSVYAQNQSNAQKPDTSIAVSNAGSILEVDNKINSLFTFDKRIFIAVPPNFPPDSTSILMRTRLLLGKMTSEDPIKTNFKLSILNPLHQLYVESQSMKELKYILGAVQAGAAGFMAYQHLKKYGFLKRK